MIRRVCRIDRRALILVSALLPACGVRNEILIDQRDSGMREDDAGTDTDGGSSGFELHTDWCYPTECNGVEMKIGAGSGHIECRVSLTVSVSVGNCGDLTNDASTRVTLQLGDADGPHFELEPLAEAWTGAGMPPDGWQELEFFVPWHRLPAGAAENGFDAYVVSDPDELITECRGAESSPVAFGPC